MKLGYCLSSEQFAPAQLLEQGQMAEKAGFSGLMISDHLQPWVPSQGHSGHALTILGALSQLTKLPLSTGVSCAGARCHPIILAQISATLECLVPGHFTLGVGTGEALNEHVFGTYWPEPKERVQQLLEGVNIIRKLWSGQELRFKGEHFKVESLRLYTLPPVSPKLMIASSGPYLCSKAASLADIWLTVWTNKDKLSQLMAKFRDNGGADKTARLQLHVSWDTSMDKAIKAALKEWPNGGLNFPKGDIRFPEVLAEMAKMVRPEHFENRVIIAASVQPILEVLKICAELGFNEVYLHNCGLNQAEFIEMCRVELLPAWRRLSQS
ncbi:MAG: TIGR03557 family F420-dependent LLM class oxidoreductase [Candidatus Bruticola sp.]